jgi:PAS domain-containing protein
MRAVKVRRKFASGPVDEITDDALSACDAMMRDLTDAHLENQRLRAELGAESDAWEHLFESVPSACLLTSADGVILKANAAAGELLNVSPKRLKERQLLLFTEDRDRLAEILTALSVVAPQLDATLTLRPKERRPVVTSVIVTAATQDQQAAWLWFLAPREERSNRREIRAASPGEPHAETTAPSSYVPPA